MQIARIFGWTFRNCMPKARQVSGYFEVSTANQGILALQAAGLDPQLSGTQLSLGCAPGDNRPAGNVPSGSPVGVMPQNGAQTAIGAQTGLGGTQLPGTPQTQPYGVPAPSSGYIPPAMPEHNPDEDIGSLDMRTSWLPGKKLSEILKGLPGVSVLADPEMPGPITILGPRKWVMEAKRMASRLDVCPVQVEVSAIIVAKSGSNLAKRAFGVKVDISNGNLMFGGVPVRDTGIALNVGPLMATLQGLRDKTKLDQVYVSTSVLTLGADLDLSDGGQVAISTGETSSEVGTITSRTYRNVGHSLKVHVTAASGGYVTGTINHELSAQAGGNEFGPAFTSRAVNTAFRALVGTPFVMAVSGQDSTEFTHRRGLLSTDKTSSASTAGGYVILIFTPSGCAQSAEGRSAAGAARGDEDLQ